MEAIDLGCAMARTWWRPILAAWLPFYLGATLLLHLAFHGNPAAAIFALWWLKPLFDRAVLEVLSRAAFGEHPGVRDVLAAVWKSPGLIASLTYYRFDLARSFNLPIWHLERLRGRAASRRARALHGRSRRYAVWATIVFLHFEQLVIMVALWGAIDLFTPEVYDNNFGLKTFLDGDKSLAQQWLYAAFYAAAVTLIEPFYVAAGFALYLNRRTQLEAWDVELALRRYARRERIAPAAAVVLIVAALFAAQPETAYAASRESPQDTIREILAAPEFEQYKDIKRLQYVGPGWGSDERQAQRAPTRGGGLFAEIARLALWIGVGVLLAVALYYLRRLMPQWAASPRMKRAAPPSAIFGLEIAPESLPADVAAAALAAIEEGNVRGGLGLLYRGALSVLVHGNGLEVAAGDTEGDCVRRVAAQGDADRARFFGELVAAWQTAAYAGRLPETAGLRALCREWPAHFSRAAP